MNKIFTLLACVLLYCSAKAEVPVSVIVQTTDGTSEIFILNENTRFEFTDNEVCVIYPDGEYSLSYDQLKKIEYSGVSGIKAVENEVMYSFSGNKLTVEAAPVALEISLYTPTAETVYHRKVNASESAVIDFSGFKGIYILKINGTSLKLILK